MQEKIKYDDNYPKELSDNFYKYRIEAENIARLSDEQEEVTLVMIYDVLASKFDLSLDMVSQLISLEIEYEVANIIPITENIQKLRAINPNNVICISDTYLCKENILKLLKVVGINVNPNYIFISSEIGKTKHTGNLFRYVLKHLNIKPSQLLHMGDNLHSDIQMAKNTQIATQYYGKASLQKMECDLLQEKDNLTQQITVGALRYLRMNASTDLYVSALCLAAIPLVYYVLWCLRFSKNLNIEKIHFVSRDGQVLREIAKIIIGNDLRSYPEINYFFTSRYASYFATYSFPMNAEDIEKLFPDSDMETIESIIDKFQIQKYKNKVYEKFGNCMSNKILTTMEKNKVIAYILKDQKIYKYIREKFIEQQQLAFEYYKQEGLGNGKNALIDIGWQGTTYTSIFSSLGSSENLYALYFGFNSKEYSLNKYKTFSFFSHFSNHKYINANLLEFFASANHGTVIGYKKNENRIEPVFKTSTNLDIDSEDLKTIREAFSDFAYALEPFLFMLNNNDMSKLLDSFSKVIKTPEFHLILPLKKFSFSTNVGDTQSSKLVNPILLKEVYMETLFNKPIKRIWLEGSWSITPKIILINRKLLLATKEVLKKIVHTKKVTHNDCGD